jgi:hypothetical protein
VKVPLFIGDILMSSASPISPFDPAGADGWSKGSSGLAKQLCDAGLFLRQLRLQLRFGELTRAPLRLLHFQINDDIAECEWIARQQDPWDAFLSTDIGRRHASLQALKDAIDIRSLLFATQPDIDRARLRIHRESPRGTREVIIIGDARRHDSIFRSVHSIAMRAKLIGFRFSMENGMLCRLIREEQAHACNKREIQD